MQHIDENQQRDKLVSDQMTGILFKHSTACSISAGALQEVRYIDEQDMWLPVYRVDVIESRPVSQYISQQSGVEHQSPQIIFFKDGVAVYDASHRLITRELIKKIIEKDFA